MSLNNLWKNKKLLVNKFYFIKYQKQIFPAMLCENNKFYYDCNFYDIEHNIEILDFCDYEELQLYKDLYFKTKENNNKNKEYFNNIKQILTKAYNFIKNLTYTEEHFISKNQQDLLLNINFYIKFINNLIGEK